jgi:hypothetical protein
MLASITPLGERGRGQHWGWTTGFFVVGASAGGALLGGAFGLLGLLMGLDQTPLTFRLAGIGLILLLGGALDSGLFGLGLPSVRRQVNEEWLDQYRGWVYGLGFGFQLGTGVATIVTSAAVYGSFLIAFASGSPVTGAALGAWFGMVRAATLFAVAGVDGPHELRKLGGRLQRLEARSKSVSVFAQAGIAALALSLAVL